jgi:hypothetical protein
MALHIESKLHRRIIANMDFQSSVKQMFRLQGYTSVSAICCQPYFLIGTAGLSIPG